MLQWLFDKMGWRPLNSAKDFVMSGDISSNPETDKKQEEVKSTEPEQPVREKVVVLMSGGLDSAVTAFEAAERGYEVHPLVVLYGQKASDKEMQAVTAIHEAFTAKYPDRAREPKTAVLIGPYSSSPLVQSGPEIQSNTNAEMVGRNATLLSLAGMYAADIGARKIWIGFCAALPDRYVLNKKTKKIIRKWDGPPAYKDTDQKFLELMQGVIRHSTGDNTISVLAPFQFHPKYELIDKGTKLGVPVEKTWSCYQGGPTPCGICQGCKSRISAERIYGWSHPKPKPVEQAAPAEPVAASEPAPAPEPIPTPAETVVATVEAPAPSPTTPDAEPTTATPAEEPKETSALDSSAPALVV